MVRTRILITVKTYPTLSRKYGETVCTAGVRQDGSWVRLYPVPFRRLEEKEQYRKFDWIEYDIEKRDADPRPESYFPLDPRQLVPIGHMGTEYQWRERRNLLLKSARVFSRLEDLIREAKTKLVSLAVFKPTKILAFRWEEEDRDWDPDKVAEMRAHTKQGELFSEDRWRETFKLMPKLPYSFSYRFADDAGRESELQILDWETGALYWNCFRRSNGDEKVALEKMRAKYLDEFLQTDLHLFLGTTQQFHYVAPNPWVIVGVFPIPHESQMELV